MAKEEDLTKEVVGGVRGLFDRIGEFFHLFDLSFFVSGAATFAAAAYWYLRQTGQPTFPALPTWAQVISIIVACYICGLLSFAAGRFSARLWRRTLFWRKNYFPIFLKETIEAHDAASEDIARYLDGTEKPWRLYERLWVDLRESREHGASFSLLNRYWVMAATYDGIAISSLVWAVVLFFEPPVTEKALVFPILAAASSGLSFWQGHNYFKYQVHEIAATLASSRRRLILDRSA